MKARWFVRLASLSFVLVFGAPALAGVGEVSRSPAGRDIIAACREALHADMRINRVAASRPLTEDDYATMIRIFDYFPQFNSISEMRAEIAKWEPRVRAGQSNNMPLCAARRRLQQLQNPGLVGGHKPAPRPNAVVKSAPQGTAPQPAISAQQLRDAAAAAALDRLRDSLAVRYPNILPCTWRSPSEIQNPCVKNNMQNFYTISAAMLDALEQERQRMSPEFYQRMKSLYQKSHSKALGFCSDLAASTTPCGLPAPDSAYGKKSRVIARDGRHAMACVKLETIALGDSSTSGGSRVLANRCSGPVEIAWCYVGGECERNSGNMWTIGPGRSWPVSAQKEIRWGACHGANTIHGDPGSNGTYFTCSKQAR